MQFVKCSMCGRLIVAADGEDLDEARRRHAELDDAALDSLRALFPRWVDGNGICEACAEHLRQIVREPEPRY